MGAFSIRKFVKVSLWQLRARALFALSRYPCFTWSQLQMVEHMPHNLKINYVVAKAKGNDNCQAMGTTLHLKAIIISCWYQLFLSVSGTDLIPVELGLPGPWPVGPQKT
jgi:hypothetical protein